MMLYDVFSYVNVLQIYLRYLKSNTLTLFEFFLYFVFYSFLMLFALDFIIIFIYVMYLCIFMYIVISVS